MSNEDKPELGGIFVWIGAIGGALLGIEATSGGAETFWGAVIGFLIGAGVGRVVERVVARLIVLAVTLLVIYVRVQSCAAALNQ
jgi:hypothetical protein